MMQLMTSRVISEKSERRSEKGNVSGAVIIRSRVLNAFSLSFVIVGVVIGV